MLAFVHVDFQRNQLLLIIKFRVRHRSEVDVPQLAVGVAEVIEPFGNLFAAEDLAVFDRKQAAERPLVGHRFVALKRYVVEAVPVALLNRKSDVNRFPRPMLDERNMKSGVARVMDLSLGIFN